jgi:F-box and WD-40 domain protein 1/11
MHRSLASRPKTSSAATDDNTTAPFDHTMKRTASQTFTNAYCDADRYGLALDAVNEADSSSHAGESALSRALGNLTGSFTRQKSRRRLSSFSSASAASSRHRRPSIQSFIDSLPSSQAARKSSNEQQRLPLPHTDSGIPSLPVTTPSPTSANKAGFIRRLSSMRRKPAVPQPSGEPSRTPQHHTSLLTAQVMGGASARQSAAAANESRLNQLREQEHTYRFIHGLNPSNKCNIDFDDNESGVDMTCSSPIVRTDSAREKKMSKSMTRLLMHCIYAFNPDAVY